jgi:hypothetical protein
MIPLYRARSHGVNRHLPGGCRRVCLGERLLLLARYLCRKPGIGICQERFPLLHRIWAGFPNRFRVQSRKFSTLLIISEANVSQRIQHILEAYFDRCLLAHWLRYEALPDQHIECFRQGGPEAGRRVFMVHVCSKGSQVAYYVGSHLHKFKTTKGLRSVFEVSPEELSRAGCEPEALNFPNGGL